MFYRGKRHYLGRERRSAESAYLEHLAEWKAWRDNREFLKPALPKASRTITVSQIIEEFVRAKRIERGYKCEDYYLYALRRFEAAFGGYAASLIRPVHIDRFKQALILKEFAHKTINHELTAIRVLFNWASAFERIPMVNLSAVKNLPLGPTQPKFLTHAEVKAALKQARPVLAAWLAVQYLTLMRPSEMVRVAHGEGEWVEDGVFVLHRGKTDERAPIKRHVCFSKAALKWHSKVKPQWANFVNYSRACEKIEIRPSTLRKSAARHLAERGAGRDEIEMLLGHTGPRIAVTYFHPPWQRLREVAAMLKI